MTIIPAMRILPLSIAVAFMLAACTASPTRNPLATWVPSPNFEARQPVIIVLHATEQESVAQSLDTLRSANSGGKVSAHYLIGDDGKRYQLVADDHRAWHAGGGSWGTITDLNSASIGIELDNDGHEPFSDAQIASLIVLLEDLCRRFAIPKSQVIAHADMAPARKRDPGAHFPWRRLAEAGFGRWPKGALSEPPPGFDPWLAMAAIGYPLKDKAAALRAFHRHFRGRDDGETTDVAFDAEDLRILHALASPTP